MKVKNAEDDFFLIREDATKEPINKLDDFLGKKYSYIDDTKEPATETVSGSLPLLPSTVPTSKPTKPLPCDEQALSESYNAEIQQLMQSYSPSIFSNIRNNAIANFVLLKKENKKINLSEFQTKLIRGELKGRKVYHVCVGINCKISCIEIE